MRTFTPALAAWSLILLFSAFVVGQDQKDNPGVAREIDLKEYQGSRINGDILKPRTITSAAELARAIPDKAWQERIARQVNFAKEHLLFFAWAGSGQDRLSLHLEGRGKALTVVFLYTRGLTDDLRSHFRLFAVAKDAVWEVRRTGNAAGDNPNVRLIRGVKGPWRWGDQEATEITTEEGLTRIFGDAPHIRAEVDFSREKLVWVNWAGSSSSYLTHTVRSRNGKITLVLAVETPRPALTDYRQHGALVVMPRDTAWVFGVSRLAWEIQNSEGRILDRSPEGAQ
jgi:hypothetical protein